MGSATHIEARRRWVILGVAYLCLLSFGITLQSVPPVLSLIIGDLALSHSQAGLLMSAFALPGVIISIPAGMLADRYGQKIIGIASFALMIAGTAVFASGDSLAVLILGRALSGAGAMTLMVLAPQLLAQWFAGREVGIAMGVFNSGMPLATVLSLNFLSLLGQNAGWRAGIWVSAGVSVVGLIVFALLFTPVPRSREVAKPPSESFFRSIKLAGGSIWIVGLAWMFFNAAVISLFTFTPDFLRAEGFSVASAGFVTGAIMWPAILLSPIVGYVIDKVGRKRTIIAIGGLTLAVLVVLIPEAIGWILVLMLLIGIVQTLVPVPIFALAPEVSSPERLGLGFGIISTCLNLGIVIGPAGAGIVRDIYGSYQASYALMAGFAILVALAMVVLSRRKGKLPMPPNQESVAGL